MSDINFERMVNHAIDISKFVNECVEYYEKTGEDHPRLQYEQDRQHERFEQMMIQEALNLKLSIDIDEEYFCQKLDRLLLECGICLQ